MGTDSEVLLIGAGHNALVAAAYLSRAGLSVTLLEEHSAPGGGTGTEELTEPGFLHDPFSTGHSFLQFTPLIAHDELGLVEGGLRYVAPDPILVLQLADGETLTMSLDLEETVRDIARFSKRDGDAFRDLISDWDLIAPQMIRTLAAAPGDFKPDPASAATAKMAELAASTAAELIRDRFEDEHTRDLLYWLLAGTGTPPNRPGSGVSVVLGAGLYSRASWPHAVGGSRALIDGLIAVVEAHGGQVRCGSRVDQVIVEGDRAVAVRTADGETYTASKAIVSSANATELPKLLGPGHLPSEFDALDSWVAGPSLLVVHLALDRTPSFETSSGPQEVTLSGFGTSAGVAQQAEDIAAGKLTGGDRNMLAACSSVVDPSRAPEGKAVVKLITWAPYALGGDAANWEQEKEAYAEKLLAVYAERAQGYEVGEEIARVVDAPPDIERRDRQLVGGSPVGGEAIPTQLGLNRPVPGWSSYRMPVTGLYQTGASTHPGGGVTGFPGRNTARVVLEDLGINPAPFMREDPTPPPAG